MVKYYSQHGEDFLLDQIFEHKEEGYFVEVGCIDGRRFSNTLTFEERGWKGMCVEAHEGFIELLKKNRPGSIICHCAAAEQDEEGVTFYANARGSLSTLDPNKESEFKEKFKEYFTGFQKQQVQKRRLDTLFKENKVGKIDILSIDIEGYELEALRGIEFNKCRPRVIVVESDSKEDESSLDNLLIGKGYYKSVRVGGNIFYFIDRELAKNIEGKKFSVDLIHTRHPLDEGEDAHVTVELDLGTDILTRLKKYYRQWRS
jgi:FkbM family methyltransferase